MADDQVWAVDWTEYERGWGSRPAGTTYYESQAEADQACREAVAGRDGPAPDVYLQPGAPYRCERPLHMAPKGR